MSNNSQQFPARAPNSGQQQEFRPAQAQANAYGSLRPLQSAVSGNQSSINTQLAGQSQYKVTNPIASQNSYQYQQQPYSSDYPVPFNYNQQSYQQPRHNYQQVQQKQLQYLQNQEGSQLPSYSPFQLMTPQSFPTATPSNSKPVSFSEFNATLPIPLKRNPVVIMQSTNNTPNKESILKDGIQQLQNELMKIKISKNKEILDLNSQISNLRHENQVNFREYTDNEEILNARIASLSQLNQEFELKLSNMTQNNAIIAAESKANLDKISQLENDNEKLELQISKTRSEMMEKIALQRVNHQKEIDELKNYNAEQHKDTELFIHQQLVEDNRELLKSQVLLQNKVKELTLQLEQYIQKESLMKQEVVDAFSHLDTMHINNKKLRDRILAIETTFQSEQLACKSNKEEASKSVETLSTTNQSLEKTIKSQKLEQDETIKRLELKISTLQLKYEDIVSSNKILKDEVLVLVDAKQTLKKSLEEYDYHVTSIENQYAALKDENSTLKRNLESKTKLLMDSSSQIR